MSVCAYFGLLVFSLRSPRRAARVALRMAPDTPQRRPVPERNAIHPQTACERASGGRSRCASLCLGVPFVALVFCPPRFIPSRPLQTFFHCGGRAPAEPHTPHPHRCCLLQRTKSRRPFCFSFWRSPLCVRLRGPGRRRGAGGGEFWARPCFMLSPKFFVCSSWEVSAGAAALPTASAALPRPFHCPQHNAFPKRTLYQNILCVLSPAPLCLVHGGVPVAHPEACFTAPNLRYYPPEHSLRPPACCKAR